MRIGESFRVGKINILYGIIYPLILLLICVATIFEGIDLSDSMYSLTSYKLFLQAEGDWALFFSYFLANFVGFLFTLLPFGKTLAGIRFYTSLVIYATALVPYVYFGKRKEISYDIMFLGELLAICYCWCPSTVLYNFLSYLIWTIAFLVLRSGLLQEKNSYLLIAGVLLGVNVITKMPNITAAIMILVVIYHYFFFTKKEKGEAVKITVLFQRIGFCIAGFLAGFGVLWFLMEVIYGFGTYGVMLKTIFTMTDTATDYKASAQILKILVYYKETFIFMAGMILAVAAGCVMMKLCSKIKWLYRFSACVYVICIPVLFRLYYGRGLFGIDYQSDFAIVYVGTLFLWLVIMTCVVLLGKKSENNAEDIRKMDALMLLLIIFITPLGSNNGVYPVLDNLFLIAPLGISMFLKLWKKKGPDGIENNVVPLAAETMFSAFLMLMLVQGLLFHANFSFKGQDDYEKRDTKIQNNDILRNMKTNEERALPLEEMLEAAEKALVEQDIQYMLTYGYLPGLYFILDAKPVLSTTWPDLDSYSSQVMEEKLAGVEEQVMLVLSKEAYEDVMGNDNQTQKEKIIHTFIDKQGISVQFENEEYVLLY